MRITSPEFANNHVIPSKYTCDGENISPPLEFLEVPKGTKSLALIMEDPDVPKNIRPDGMWDHWIAFNIPPEINSVLENQNPPGMLGKNTYGDMAYGGPCPPYGQHRYFFKLYALDSMLDIPPSSNKQDILTAIASHIIEQAELIGLYQRRI